MFCKRCGTQLPNGARFCPGCGLDLSGVSRPPVRQAAGPEPKSEPEPKPEPKPKKGKEPKARKAKTPHIQACVLQVFQKLMDQFLPIRFFCGADDAAQIGALPVKEEGGGHGAYAGQKRLADGVVGQQVGVARSGFPD